MPGPTSTATAEHYVWHGAAGVASDGWHLVRARGLSVIQERMPPGAREVRHWHARAHQFFFVLAGRLHVEVEGSTHVLERGSGLEISPGLAHEVRNEGPEVAELLVVSHPPSHGDRTPAPLDG